MNYTFRNKKTDKIFVKEMKMSEREPYLKKNPNIEQIFTNTFTVTDPLRIGVQKPPSDFQKFVLGRIKDKHPGIIGERHFGIPREI